MAYDMLRDELLDRAVEVLRADPRVSALWLAGSLGRGNGDEFSDVDLLIEVDEAGWDEFIEGWDALVERIAPVVLRQRIGGGRHIVFTHVTDEWLRFDASVVAAATVAAGLTTIFDRAGTRVPPPVEPEPSRVVALTTEFLRVLGLLPVVLGRREYVVGASGAGLLRGLLVQLMLDDVPERGGALRLRGILPDDQLAALAALPPIEATRESVLAVHLACAALFRPLARERAGDGWPGDLDLALREHLRRTLGTDLDTGIAVRPNAPRSG